MMQLFKILSCDFSFEFLKTDTNSLTPFKQEVNSHISQIFNKVQKLNPKSIGKFLDKIIDNIEKIPNREFEKYEQKVLDRIKGLLQRHVQEICLEEQNEIECEYYGEIQLLEDRKENDDFGMVQILFKKCKRYCTITIRD